MLLLSRDAAIIFCSLHPSPSLSLAVGSTLTHHPETIIGWQFLFSPARALINRHCLNLHKSVVQTLLFTSKLKAVSCQAILILFVKWNIRQFCALLFGFLLRAIKPQTAGRWGERRALKHFDLSYLDYWTMMVCLLMIALIPAPVLNHQNVDPSINYVSLWPDVSEWSLNKSQHTPPPGPGPPGCSTKPERCGEQSQNFQSVLGL